MNGEHMVTGLEENKKQYFTINNVQGQELVMTEFKHGNLVLGISEVTEVVEKITEIWNGQETYQ